MMTMMMMMMILIIIMMMMTYTGEESTDIFLMVIVLTAMRNYARRTLIRNTWAMTSQFSVGVKVVFLIGRKRRDVNSALQNSL